MSLNGFLWDKHLSLVAHFRLHKHRPIVQKLSGIDCLIAATFMSFFSHSRRRGRTGKSGRSTWIVPELINWTRHQRPGLSMVVAETTSGYQVFKYVHNQTYQQCQFKFLEAVESLNPENIMVSGRFLFSRLLIQAASYVYMAILWS